MNFKKITALILSLILLISVCTVAPFNATEIVDLTTISAPQFAEKNQIYVLGTTDSKEAWQCWESYENGLYSEAGVKYFFLPENTDSDNIIIYNSYNGEITMNGVTIPANSAGSVPYVTGEKATVVYGWVSYEYIVLKSDADASIYVNDTTNDYTNDEGEHFTDFYEFLIDSKENSVKGSDIAIVTDEGFTETTLKKFKGRGNTNWNHSDKKQFTLTFDDTMDIAGVSDKKFSLINNERDGAVVRNKVIYDVANEVGLPYSTDTRYIDLYINGSYRGCFQISKKVEMGKKDLIALEDTSEDEGVLDNFNFAVEVDIWNAGSDTQFKSKYGQTVALNTPELEDYDPLDPVQLSQYNFIKNKYNEFETALYTGNMATLEKICDIQSLSRAYLIQEWTKNCDGGLTSTYYTYKADEGKFYAVPVWDFDSGLGNVDCMRAGADISTVYPNGWLTKTITNDNGRGVTNTLGQAFKLTGTTSDGKTYLDFVKETWKNDFIPAIKVVVGQAPSKGGRLKSIDEYISQYDNAFYNNYVQWGFAWGPEKGLGAKYAYTFQGQVDYMRDWTVTRTNWITQELLGDEGEKLEEPVLPTEPPTELDPNASFYLAGTIDSYTDWFRRDYPLTFNEDRTKATIDLTLLKGETYRFKIIKDIRGENVDYYVCDYEAGVTGQYFFADTSTQSLNVKSKHTETVELTLVFDVATGLFTAYHKGEVPTDPIATEPSETTQPSESTVPSETTTPSESTAPSETTPTESTSTEPTESVENPTAPSESTEPSETTPTESTIVTEPTEKTPVLNKTDLSLKAGKTATLSVKNADSKVTFKSDKPNVAKVDSNGIVTALKKGSAIITATVDGKQLECNVKITTNPKIKKGKKTVSNNSVIKMKKGKKLKLKITGKGKNIANNISIKNATNVKITGKKIVIKCNKKGIIKISAKINGVKKYNFRVKVR